MERVFHTDVPNMKLIEGQMIPDFIINALNGQKLIINGDESFSASFCYVTDIVDGLVRLMATAPDVQFVDLGDDKIIKGVDVAKSVIGATNSSSEIVFEKPLLFLTRKGAPDLAYAKDVLGWMPLVRLQDGLEKTIDYTIANKEALLFNRGY